MTVTGTSLGLALPTHQGGQGDLGCDSFVADQFDLFGYRHLDPAGMGEVADGQTALDSLGSLPGGLLRRLQGLAAAEVFPEGPVARHRRHARADEVAEPGQPRER